jgi:hypothetical protein
MRLFHAEPGVGARPAGVLAQLVDELLGQSLQVGPGELLIDAVVLPRTVIKARATAVMASTPPRRSYREPSTVSHLLCSRHQRSDGLPRIAHPQTV